MRPKSYRIRWNNANLGAISPFKVIQGHRVWYQSKAHNATFLLSCTVSEIAFDRSKITIFGYRSCVLPPPPPNGGVPWDNLRKILPGCRRVAKVTNSVETLSKISIAWVGCTNITHRRQTDRQTDRRATTYSDREREFRFVKNSSVLRCLRQKYHVKDWNCEDLWANVGQPMSVGPTTQNNRWSNVLLQQHDQTIMWAVGI